MLLRADSCNGYERNWMDVSCTWVAESTGVEVDVM